MSRTPVCDSGPDGVEQFYDGLADYYHLLFQDWEGSIGRQAAVLGPLIERYTGKTSARVLDCACGIGTQALGLARLGHRVTATDLSAAAVERARVEAQRRGLSIDCRVADMRRLQSVGEDFDAVLAGDNALPHLLTPSDLESALRGMARTLQAQGVLLATVRDYDRLLRERPTMQAPSFFEEAAGQRFVHQVWDWDGKEYALHLYLTMRSAGDPAWTVKHFCSRYRALGRQELTAALHGASFSRVEWIEPEESGFYQPIVVASKGEESDA